MIQVLLSLLLRVGLLLMGIRMLVMVIQSTMNSFDIFVVASDDDDNNKKVPFWLMFLGGEFTFSCLFQIGYHMIQASIQGGRSLSTFVVMSVLVGITFGQMAAKNILLVDTMTLIMAFSVMVTYSVVDNRGRSPMKMSAVSPKTKFFTPIRILVKSGSFLLICTGVIVLGMGLEARQPSDILPQLVWQGFGYEYNLSSTFGKTTAESKDFFTMLLCTMLGTICQTLCAGIWIFQSPIGSDACRQGLWFSCTGVPLIILANGIAASLYQHANFTEGRNCMIAHILLLVQTNAHLPVIWWIHDLWAEMVLVKPDDSAAILSEEEKKGKVD